MSAHTPRAAIVYGQDLKCAFWRVIFVCMINPEATTFPGRLSLSMTQCSNTQLPSYYTQTLYTYTGYYADIVIMTRKLAYIPS